MTKQTNKNTGNYNTGNYNTGNYNTGDQEGLAVEQYEETLRECLLEHDGYLHIGGIKFDIVELFKNLNPAAYKRGLRNFRGSDPFRLIGVSHDIDLLIENLIDSLIDEKLKAQHSRAIAKKWQWRDENSQASLQKKRSQKKNNQKKQ